MLGSKAHRAIAREAVRKSLVLLKNDRGTLPLSPHGTLLVAGSGADDIGQQTGGWTIDWQGAHNTNADFPGATSIFAGLKAAMEAGGGTAVLSPAGDFAGKPTAAVVVFGEHPYAEFQGDRETLEFSTEDQRELKLMQGLRARGIPVVAVFLSGRPMWVNRELNASDAFVAAWLPGSEGEGIADVLVRSVDERVRYDFSGRLSFSWPATPTPVVLDTSDNATGALHARGFGLDYAHPAGASKPLAETAAATAAWQPAGILFAGARVRAPWSIYVSDSSAEVRLTTASQPSPTGAVAIALKPGVARVTWAGTGSGVVRIGGRPVDLRALAARGDVLSVRLKVERAPTSAVSLGIRCGAPYGAYVPADGSRTKLSAATWEQCKGPVAPAFDVGPVLASKVPGSWSTLEIPLSCFAGKGADLTAVEAPFAMSTQGALAVTIANVRIARATDAGGCPTQ